MARDVQHRSGIGYQELNSMNDILDEVLMLVGELKELMTAGNRPIRVPHKLKPEPQGVPLRIPVMFPSDDHTNPKTFIDHTDSEIIINKEIKSYDIRK